MKKTNKFFCLLLLIGLFQISGTLAAEDYSKMSTVELDAAFVLAVEKARAENVQELLQAGANVNTPIPDIVTSGDCDWMVKSTALMYAVRHNYPDMAKVLIKTGKNLNEALDEAIKKGYSDIVEELIKGGAGVNYVNKDGDTPLLIAVRYSSQKIIQTLLKAGANTNHVNSYGRTALMEAVREHDLNTVQSLLQVPAMTAADSYFGFGTKPINYADEDGNTALILAIQHVRYRYINGNRQEYNDCKNSQNIIKALLETPGIDAHHVNKNGETAITLLKKLDEKMNR